jgi:hypothetical protein
MPALSLQSALDFMPKDISFFGRLVYAGESYQEDRHHLEGLKRNLTPFIFVVVSDIFR